MHVVGCDAHVQYASSYPVYVFFVSSQLYENLTARKYFTRNIFNTKIYGTCTYVYIHENSYMQHIYIIRLTIEGFHNRTHCTQLQQHEKRGRGREYRRKTTCTCIHVYHQSHSSYCVHLVLTLLYIISLQASVPGADWNPFLET